MTIIELHENETIASLMQRMTDIANSTRDEYGYSTVRASVKGVTLEAYAIQQNYNSKKVKQMRWSIDGINVAKAAMEQFINANFGRR